MAEGSAKTARNSKLVDHSKTGQQKPFRENTRKTKSETEKYIRGTENRSIVLGKQVSWETENRSL